MLTDARNAPMLTDAHGCERCSPSLQGGVREVCRGARGICTARGGQAQGWSPGYCRWAGRLRVEVAAAGGLATTCAGVLRFLGERAANAALRLLGEMNN